MQLGIFPGPYNLAMSIPREPLLHFIEYFSRILTPIDFRSITICHDFRRSVLRAPPACDFRPHPTQDSPVPEGEGRMFVGQRNWFMRARPGRARPRFAADYFSSHGNSREGRLGRNSKSRPVALVPEK